MDKYKYIQKNITEQQALIEIITQEQHKLYPDRVENMKIKLANLKADLKNLTEQYPNINFTKYY